MAAILGLSRGRGAWCYSLTNNSNSIINNVTIAPEMSLARKLPSTRYRVFRVLRGVIAVPTLHPQTQSYLNGFDLPDGWVVSLREQHYSECQL